MKKLNILLAAIALMTAIFTGCSGSAGDPKSVLVAFFDKMSKKDLEGAAKLATKESKPTLDMMKKAMDMGEKFKDANTKEEDPADEFNNMEIGEAKISGDEATVSVTNKKKKETFDFPLKKQDGGWKVDFSMATLAKMGMDKAKKEGDMDQKDIDDLKNFNMDSLNQGLKTLDSALKSIKPEDLEKMKNMGEEIKKQMEAAKQ
ncbi:MAG TPA: DUF4878 domain-containing protein [Chitinophagaceae bacterium]|nr:DUF4878 domain-containing protein [Chitinophagaceae bacterium]HPH30703.1 DUF4878 domain-containing protein [Chitinophagaceae bacterium]HPN58128.1 DUF4878 domain-containing protein [Chitinophagaceae bacterium]